MALIRFRWVTVDERVLERRRVAYMRRRGGVRSVLVTARLHEADRRWHYAPWLPWPRSVLRWVTIEFPPTPSDPDGLIASPLRRGETLVSCLRRMERAETA